MLSSFLPGSSFTNLQALGIFYFLVFVAGSAAIAILLFFKYLLLCHLLEINHTSGKACCHVALLENPYSALLVRDPPSSNPHIL